MVRNGFRPSTVSWCSPWLMSFQTPDCPRKRNSSLRSRGAAAQRGLDPCQLPGRVCAGNSPRRNSSAGERPESVPENSRDRDKPKRCQGECVYLPVFTRLQMGQVCWYIWYCVASPSPPPPPPPLQWSWVRQVLLASACKLGDFQPALAPSCAAKKKKKHRKLLPPPPPTHIFSQTAQQNTRTNRISKPQNRKKKTKKRCAKAVQASSAGSSPCSTTCSR